MDEDKLNEMLGRFVGDLGATITAGGVVIGHRLGLYRALVDGPGTADELARRTGCDPRYVAEWLRGQAAGGYVTYDARGRHLVADRGAGLRAGEPGRRGLRPRRLRAGARLAAGDRPDRGGVPDRRRRRLARARRRGLRRLRAVLPARLPRQPGAELDPGARRRRRPSSRPAPRSPTSAAGSARRPSCSPSSSPGAARWAATTTRGRSSWRASGPPTPASPTGSSFEVASAQDFPGSDYDLVATFDCLHDMGDPVGAARHIRQSLADDGTWLIVEPIAGDTVADNLNPVGRVYYGFSTFLCVPERAVPDRRLLAGRPGRREGDRRGGRARPASPGSAGPRRRRSTSSSKRGPERSTVMTGMRTAGARGTVGPVRAREPDRAGYAVRSGVRLYYEVHGDGPTTVLLLPPWSIVHSRIWKLQVPYLARHAQVVVYDARGNGRSDRPAGPSAYDDAELVADAVAVLDAVGVQEAVVVGLSLGARVLLGLAADHPDRVRGRGVRRRRTSMLQDRPNPIGDAFERSGRATTAGGAGTRTTGAGTRPGSRSSSSARRSRSRTRPGRSRTRWRGRSRPTRRRWSRPASPRRRVLGHRRGAGRRPRRCAVRAWCCTATTTAITPLSDGVALARALGSPLDVVARRRPLRAGPAPGLVQPAAAPLRRGGDGRCAPVSPTWPATSTATG